MWGGPQDPLWLDNFLGEITGFACNRTDPSDLSSRKDTKQNQKREKKFMEQNLGEIRCKLPQSPPSGATQHEINSPQNESWWHAYKVATQRSSLEIRHSGFLTGGLSHRHGLPLAHGKHWGTFTPIKLRDCRWLSAVTSRLQLPKHLACPTLSFRF